MEYTQGIYTRNTKGIDIRNVYKEYIQGKHTCTCTRNVYKEYVLGICEESTQGIHTRNIQGIYTKNL